VKRTWEDRKERERRNGKEKMGKKRKKIKVPTDNIH
jgi:hypothetical protein